MIGIYKITSPTGRIYIGQSIDIEYRFNDYSLLRCKTQKKLYRSFLKHGFENHKLEVIEECSVDVLNERERYWQDYYDVLNIGLNCVLTKTNDKSGKKSYNTRIKISESRKGTPAYNREVLFNTETGIYYDSFLDASVSINKTRNYLVDRLSSCSCINNTSFIYADEEKNKRYNKKILIKSNKKKYVKTRDHMNNIIKAKENTVFKGTIVFDEVNGIFYKSIKDASKLLSIKYDTLKRKLDGRLRNNTNLIKLNK